MNLAIVVDELYRRRDPEIYLLECLRRWQQVLPITLYTSACRAALLDEFGIDRERVVVVPPVRAASRADARARTGASAPLAARQIGVHDLYFFYRLPEPLLHHRPSVWFPPDLERGPEDASSASAPSAFSPALRPRRSWAGGACRPGGPPAAPGIRNLAGRGACADRLVTDSEAAGRYLESAYGRAPDLVAPPGTEPLTWNRTAEDLLAILCRTARRSAVPPTGHLVAARGATLAR